MKIRNLFLATLATLTLFACSKSESEDTSSSGTTKTVTLNLGGLMTSTLKSIGDKSTAGVITLRDVTVLLTDGTNIYVRKNFVSPTSDFTTITGSAGYIFHEVNPAINKVIIVGNTIGNTVDYTNVATVKSSLVQANIENEEGKDYVTLYGENVLTPGVEPAPGSATHPNSSSDYFTTTVNLAPIVARMEIGKIQCTNLGNDYTSFQLAGIGLIDFSQQVHLDGTNLSEKLSIYTGIGSLGKIYMPGLANPPAGLYEFGSAPALAWAYDAISPMPTLNAGSNSYYATGVNTKVFGYNFMPSAPNFPNVKIRLANVIRTDGNTNTFFYVSTKSFTGVGVDATHPKPGYIYQFDLAFTESNIGPWDPNSRICIDVKVTVSSWVIQVLTPVFN